MLKEDHLIKVLEALLFASDEPLTMKRLREILSDFKPTEELLKEKESAQPNSAVLPESSPSNPTGENLFEAAIQNAIIRIREKYSASDSPVVLLEVAQGWQLATNPIYISWIKKLFKDRVSFRLSQAALETLAIVGYRQPITRAEIEEIRGVEVIAALETLLERGLIRVSGRKETVGRPLLYSTTPEFLRQFGLRTLEDLPVLDSAVEFPSLSQTQAASETLKSVEAVPPYPQNYSEN